jgi:hypothetical protein
MLPVILAIRFKDGQITVRPEHHYIISLQDSFANSLHPTFLVDSCLGILWHRY